MQQGSGTTASSWAQGPPGYERPGEASACFRRAVGRLHAAAAALTRSPGTCATDPRVQGGAPACSSSRSGAVHRVAGARSAAVRVDGRLLYDAKTACSRTARGQQAPAAQLPQGWRSRSRSTGGYPMDYTRREFGRIALARRPCRWPVEAHGGRQTNSVFGGVQIGAITYSFARCRAARKRR